MNKKWLACSISSSVVGASMGWMFTLAFVATRFLMEVKESTGFFTSTSSSSCLPMTVLSMPSFHQFPHLHGIRFQNKQQTPRNNLENLVSPSFSHSCFEHALKRTRRKLPAGGATPPAALLLEDSYYYRKSSGTTFSSATSLENTRSRKKRSNLILETSTLSYLDELSTTRRPLDNYVSLIERMKQSALLMVTLDDLLKRHFKILMSTLQKHWWCIPMILLMAYPVYSLLVVSEFPKMPSWWAIKDVTHLQQMPVICSGFLGSNLSYFLSGSYLLGKTMPFDLVCNLTTSSKHVHKPARREIARCHPMLGIMVIASGFISLIYHAFQSLGHLGVAETLCFVDHGVAFSSFCYFVKACGLPSIRTLAIGIPSMALLLFPGDSYPVIHSLWHATSASATVSWAIDGSKRRKQFISSTIQKQRKKFRSRQ
jgi:hypothetical protein